MLHITRLERLANYKLSNILVLFVSYKWKEVLWMRHQGTYSQNFLRLIFCNFYKLGIHIIFLRRINFNIFLENQIKYYKICIFCFKNFLLDSFKEFLWVHAHITPLKLAALQYSFYFGNAEMLIRWDWSRLQFLIEDT